MANKKLAPNRGKHSAAKEAGESALQLARSPLSGTRRRAPPFAAENAAPAPAKNTASTSAKNKAPAPAKNTASASAKNKAPAPAKNTASASAKNKAPAPAKNTASASAKNKAPAPAKNTASVSAKNKAPALDKNKASASAKNKAPVPDKNEASASAKNKAPVPDKNEASGSAKNAVAVPAASDEDEVAAPPQDTTLRRFINFLCEKAASMPWRGLLDAFLTWVHSRSSARGEAQAAAPTEGSAHQEQREKNTQHQASPQLPEEHAGLEADGSVPTDLSISQDGRDFDEAEADRIIPAGPSISKIVEDYEKFDRYLSSDIHKEYIKIMSSCPPGMEVCTFCYFEKDTRTRRSQSHRIQHVRDWHDNLAGVKCTNCPARFPTEHVRDLHGMHCNA